MYEEPLNYRDGLKLLCEFIKLESLILFLQFFYGQFTVVMIITSWHDVVNGYLSIYSIHCRFEGRKQGCYIWMFKTFLV